MDLRRRDPTALLRATLAAAGIVCAWAVQAQTENAGATPGAAPASVMSLAQAFDAAWARQPEALALQARRDAARSQQQASQAWTPEPAALEVSNKTDRLNRNAGARELELGVVLPLWLPGERSRS